MVSSKSSILFWKDSLSEEILTDKYPVTDSYFYRYLIPSIHQQFYVWGAGCRSGIGEELLTYTLTTSSSGAVVTQVVGAFPLQPLPEPSNKQHTKTGGVRIFLSRGWYVQWLHWRSRRKHFPKKWRSILLVLNSYSLVGLSLTSNYCCINRNT